MRRSLCGWIAIGSIAAAGFAAASSPQRALADDAVVRDTRGDAKAPWDIVKIAVSNGERALRVVVDYRGRLRTGGRTGLLTNVRLDFGSPATSTYDADFTIDMLRGSADPDAPDRVHLYRHRDSGVTRVACPRLRLRLRRQAGELAFTVPQRCFGALGGRVRLVAHTYRPRADPGEADFVDDWSRWVEQD